MKEGEQLLLSVMQTPNKNEGCMSHWLQLSKHPVASVNIIKQKFCVLILNWPFHPNIMLHKDGEFWSFFCVRVFVCFYYSSTENRKENPLLILFVPFNL